MVRFILYYEVSTFNTDKEQHIINHVSCHKSLLDAVTRMRELGQVIGGYEDKHYSQFYRQFKLPGLLLFRYPCNGGFLVIKKTAFTPILEIFLDMYQALRYDKKH